MTDFFVFFVFPYFITSWLFEEFFPSAQRFSLSFFFFAFFFVQELLTSSESFPYVP